jgi:LPXTG-motif cell wall-anchored protein
MKQLVSKMTVGAVVLVGLHSGGLHRAAATDYGSDAGKVCHSLTSSWSGNVALVPGESFSTGVTVEHQLGIQSVVTSAAVSTGEGSSAATLVQIGSDVASNGAVVDGGVISISNSGTTVLHITSVDVVVTHCHVVAVSDAPSLLTPASRPPEVRASDSPLLPETGAATPGVAAAGAVLVGAGAGLVAIGRRRRRTA